MNKKYTPILKFKQNEIRALNDLKPESLDQIKPFFDLPKNIQRSDSSTAINSLLSGIKEIKRTVLKDKEFYFDIYDIPTIINSKGENFYYYALKNLLSENLKVTPVIAFNRDASHNIAALKIATEYNIESIAIRLDEQDISDFNSLKDNIDSLSEIISKNKLDIIIYLSTIFSNSDFDNKIELTKEFLDNLSKSKFENMEKLIISSSSLSKDHCPPNTESEKIRYEALIFNEITKHYGSFIYSDCGIVSPEYADEAIDPNLMQNVSTPKMTYTSIDKYNLYRGGSFKKHKRKKSQFFDLAKKITSSNEYRGSSYSNGDKFIFEKSQGKGSPSSQGNWYRNLNNAHFEYIIKDFL